jgi:hypothetical protein
MESMPGQNGSGIYREMLDIFVYDAADKIRKPAADAIHSFVSGDESAVLMKVAESLTHVPGINIKEGRRKIADKLIEENKYTF